MSNVKKIKKPELVDGIEQNKLHPETFWIPSEADIKKIKIGDIVKVACSGERFWTQVEEMDGENFVAKIDNDLVKSDEHGLYFDDLISFKAKNIINIY